MNKFVLLASLFFSGILFGQKPYSQQMADSFMAWYADSIAVKPGRPAAWDYEQGLMLKALELVWRKTADPKYFNYIQHDIDRYVQPDGQIRTYNYDDFNLDNIATGRALLMLYQQTLPDKEKYRKAADVLWKQLENQPVTKEKGYWHKLRYPYQMWLDGLFMAEPFSAEYSKIFNHPEHFDVLLRQFELIEKYLIDSETGLVYHGYDESKLQKWADKSTGRSPHLWSRAIGWYFMAMVEVLDHLPEEHSGRTQLIGYLKKLAPAIVKYQDQSSGVWFQMIALGGKEGNYLEASASAMFVYTLAKAARKGYIDQRYSIAAKNGFEGMIKEFVEKEADGSISLNKTVSVGGLGGTPYRDGSYEYYLSEPIRKNDLKGVGPFILAATEIEMLDTGLFGAGKKVGLDYHFNREFRKNWNGETEQFHYTWEDPLHSGFLWLGDIFKSYGASISAIKSAPYTADLKDLDVYIIVDPDTKKETENPNFIEKQDIAVIKKWVKNGGNLLIMANDSANCEIPHTNELTKQFGITFSKKNRNMVQGTQWEQGLVMIPENNKVFPNTQKVYIKELVTLNLSGKARSVVSYDSDVIIAEAKYGKGKVLVVGDPWMYNEYMDSRRIPMEYQNFQAAKDLAAYLLRN